MPRTDRRSVLIRRLREDGRVSVATLARDLGVTSHDPP
jgi:DeoR/GlpR family transcriptional regulator of sugar metabolism